MDLPQLFGVIPTGCPVIITPTSAPSPTSLVFTLPPRPFAHIAVFLLPGIALPPDTAAAVYLAFPSSSTDSSNAPNFKFLGGIGPGKESAIFKVNNSTPNSSSSIQNGEVDMDAPDQKNATSELILGISIEAASSVAERISSLANKPPVPTINEPSSALVLSQQNQPLNTLQLAQRIIKNAFNFLASYSGNVPGGQGSGGVEVVPLKAFEEWWRKFEGRVKNDPSFLERDVD